MLFHATAADLAATPWNCTPADPDDLLTTATLAVNEAVVTAVYDVDSAGHPTDPAVTVALRDATCAHAAALSKLGDPDQVGLDAPLVKSSKSVGSMRIGYDTGAAGSVTAYNARRQALTTLSGRALRILQQAGLTTGAPL